MADKDFVPVDNQWRTTKIDPSVIAHALRGELKESYDADSLWHINMYYGCQREWGPAYVLKLHPEKRKVLLDIPGPRWRGHKTYYASVKLSDVVDMLFAEYVNPDTGIIETDIIFCGSNRDGEHANAITVSSAGHRMEGEEE